MILELQAKRGVVYGILLGPQRGDLALTIFPILLQSVDIPRGSPRTR